MIHRVPNIPKGDTHYARLIRAIRKAGATDFCTDCFAWVTREHGAFCGHFNEPRVTTQRLGTLALVPHYHGQPTGESIPCTGAICGPW